jgi:hypothetical protein
MKHYLSHLAMLLLLPGIAAAQDLRQDPEAAYGRYEQAVRSSDITLLRQSIDTVRFVTMHNQIVSIGLQMPDGLFKMLRHIPPLDLTRLRFIQAIEKGDAAAATYIGSWEPGDPETGMALQFRKENGQWKFVSPMLITSKDLLRGLKANKKSALGHASVQPDTAREPLPPLCPIPDYIAQLSVTSRTAMPGSSSMHGEEMSLEMLMKPTYTLSISINGFTSTVESGAWLTQFIIGGLRRGTNTVSITAAPIGKTRPKVDYTVSILGQVDTSSELVTLARFTGDKPGTVTHTLVITDSIVAAAKQRQAEEKAAAATGYPSALGIETKMASVAITVNGVELRRVEGFSYTTIEIPNGLRKGENSITITVAPTNPGNEFEYSVAVISQEGEAGESKVIAAYEGDKPGTFEHTIVVDDNTFK